MRKEKGRAHTTAHSTQRTTLGNIRFEPGDGEPRLPEGEFGDATKEYEELSCTLVNVRGSLPCIFAT